MNGLLSLLLAGATIIGAVEEQAPKPKIDVSAQIYMPDGKASGASRRVELGTEPVVLYVYTGKTLCEARTVSTEKPVVAGNGWKITLLPFKSVEIIGVKSAVPKGAVEMKATWQRLWEGGKELPTGPAKSSTITLSPGNSVPLDTIDGAGRRLAHEVAVRLQRWKAGDPIPVEVQRDRIVENLSARIEAGKSEIEKMQRSLGDHHPNLVEARSSLEWLQKKRDEQVRLLIDEAMGMSAGATSVDGCAALSMNLQMEAVEATVTSPIFEIDYWLVHRDPSGKETTQHQVVRTRAPNPADFFFDDVRIETERGSVTVEVFGSTGSPWVNSNGSTGVNIGFSRRYVTASPNFPRKTKEGPNSFGTSSFNPGEVISYALPPIPSDDGALVGPRFSVRVRMKVLQ